MSIGKSPNDTVHWIVTDSPRLDGSPKSKGAIFGGTNQNRRKRLTIRLKRDDNIKDDRLEVNQRNRK